MVIRISTLLIDFIKTCLVYMASFILFGFLTALALFILVPITYGYETLTMFSLISIYVSGVHFLTGIFVYKLFKSNIKQFNSNYFKFESVFSLAIYTFISTIVYWILSNILISNSLCYDGGEGACVNDMALIILIILNLLTPLMIFGLIKRSHKKYKKDFKVERKLTLFSKLVFLGQIFISLLTAILSIWLFSYLIYVGSRQIFSILMILFYMGFAAYHIVLIVAQIIAWKILTSRSKEHFNLFVILLGISLPSNGWLSIALYMLLIIKWVQNKNYFLTNKEYEDATK